MGFLQRFLLQLLYGFRVTGYALAPFPFTLHVRKFKPESGTFPNFAVDAVIGMVESEDAFYNGKAQPAAFGGPDIIGAGLVISVPYMRQFFLRYARTVVGDFDSEFLPTRRMFTIISLSSPQYLTALLARLAMTCLILSSSAVDEGCPLARWNTKSYPSLLAAGSRNDAKNRSGRSYARSKISRFIELYLLGLHGGHGRHIADEAAHALGLVDDDRQMRVAFLRIVTGQVADHFRVGADHGQRRFEIMGNIRDQILLPVVGYAQARRPRHSRSWRGY